MIKLNDKICIILASAIILSGCTTVKFPNYVCTKSPEYMDSGQSFMEDDIPFKCVPEDRFDKSALNNHAQEDTQGEELMYKAQDCENNGHKGAGVVNGVLKCTD